MAAAGGHGGKVDVDAIWQQMNKQHTHSKHLDTAQAIWSSLASGSTRDAPSKRGGSGHAATKQLLQQQACINQARSTGSCSITHSAHAEPPDLSKASVDRLVQALQSSSTGAVRAALQQIKAAAAACLTPGHALTSKLGKALLRSLDHSSEACRELAASGLLALLQADPDASLALLPYAMPVLEERLRADEAANPTERCEEVRLLLLQLLSLIMHQTGPAIGAYASEVWSVLVAALADSFHEAAMQGCRAAQQLAGTLGRRLGGTSKDLAAALLPLTTHNRHRVRIAAIEAIRDVVHQGAHEAVLDMVGWRDPNMVPVAAFYGDDTRVNYCGKLATDHHMQVRLAFLDMVGSWMLSLGERRDHEGRLLPYVLSALCDEAPAVVAAGLVLLEQLGQAYEREHGKDLEDLLRFEAQVEEGQAGTSLAALLQAGSVRYGAAAVMAAAVTAAAVTAAAAEAGHAVAEDGAGSATAAAAGSEPSSSAKGAPAAAAAQRPALAAPLVLPGPFGQRPRLGSRVLVRNHFGGVLPALCGELSSWQAGPRGMAAKLLLVNLLAVESAAERHLHVILPALCSAIEDADASPAAADGGLVLGVTCRLPLLLDHLEPCLADWAAEPQRQARVLLVLAAVLRGGPAMRSRRRPG